MRNVLIAALFVLVLCLAIPAQAKTVCFKLSDGTLRCLTIPTKLPVNKAVIHDGVPWQY